VQVTCQLLGVVFEEKTPEELQVRLAMLIGYLYISPITTSKLSAIHSWCRNTPQLDLQW